MQIRPESPDDSAAIHVVTELAFRGHPHSDGSEPRIVRGLRDAGALSVSLVAEVDGVVVGHVAVSPVTISDGSPGWHGLGPISVLPAWQRQGVGSALMQAALERLRSQGAAGCVLLGDPAYYGRFGFAARPGLVYPGPPAAYFMALPLAGVLPQGEVSYHPAFSPGG
ncbi:N-acetyltransferase [Ideonella sp. 4Y16]|uniref:N-acetyltransferase n=1 Tax=Ideonella alba TaxID=2824118 RepID=A0A940YHL5_9BURK|nr:N-acetyltransferase [Ideonella alba]MBQ0932675.1 N-acetyltransferase [Ideonella alba]MBQ0943467.1 N-acetyltransferase [Ideonella alba]